MYKAFIVNDRQVQGAIKIADEKYRRYDPESRIIEDCLKFLYKFLEKKVYTNFPSEIHEICAAVYYIVLRNPHSYPNDTSRDDVARLFDIRVSSLDWHVKNIIEDLSLIKIHDMHMRPYFYHDLSLINTIIISQCNEYLGSHIIDSIINNKIIDIDIITDQICDKVLKRLRILPEIFEISLRDIIISLINPIILKISQGR